MVVYFYYGIKHSTLEGDPFDGNIELQATAPAEVETHDSGWSATTEQYPAELSQPGPRLFVSPAQFPTWDE